MIVPMFLFSGTFFPISQLPEVLRWIAYATPLWHGVAAGAFVDALAISMQRTCCMSPISRRGLRSASHSPFGNTDASSGSDMATLVARVVPVGSLQGLGGRRGRVLIERSLMVYRHSWIIIVSGFFEPVFYLFSIGVGLGHLVPDLK